MQTYEYKSDNGLVGTIKSESLAAAMKVAQGLLTESDGIILKHGTNHWRYDMKSARTWFTSPWLSRRYKSM